MTRVLLVEDEADFREDIADFLRLKAFEVEEVASGLEAMKCLQKKHYDAVLCDIMMPQIDGYELLEHQQQDINHTHTPFIFLTALNDATNQARARTLGCDDFLSKPVDFNVMLATLHARVNQARQRIESSQNEKFAQARFLQKIYASELMQPAIQLAETARFIESQLDKSGESCNIVRAALHRCNVLAREQMQSIEILSQAEQLLRAGDDQFVVFKLNNEWLSHALMTLNHKQPSMHITAANNAAHQHSVNTQPVLLVRCIHYLLQVLIAHVNAEPLMLSLCDDEDSVRLWIHAKSKTESAAPSEHTIDLQQYWQGFTAQQHFMNGLAACYFADVFMQRAGGKFLIHVEDDVQGFVLSWPALK